MHLETDSWPRSWTGHQLRERKVSQEDGDERDVLVTSFICQHFDCSHQHLSKQLATAGLRKAVEFGTGAGQSNGASGTVHNCVADPCQQASACRSQSIDAPAMDAHI